MFIEEAHADMPGNPPKSADYYKFLDPNYKPHEDRENILTILNDNALAFIFIFAGISLLVRNYLNRDEKTKKKKVIPKNKEK
jgi:hypothetical protein